MTEVKIRLQQTDQVKKLVDFLTPCPYEVNLVSGRYTIDAKSLLGIYSLDLSNPLTLVIYSDDCDGLLRQLRALLPDCLFRKPASFSLISVYRPARSLSFIRSGRVFVTKTFCTRYNRGRKPLTESERSRLCRNYPT